MNPFQRREIKFKAIGLVHSPFQEREGTPIQTVGGKDIEGTIELFDEFTAGLKDLHGFSHIILIYYFHKVKETVLEVKPFIDDKVRGIFSTRAPSRPNPIGLSIVKLVSIKKIYCISKIWILWMALLFWILSRISRKLIPGMSPK